MDLLEVIKSEIAQQPFFDITDIRSWTNCTEREACDYIDELLEAREIERGEDSDGNATYVFCKNIEDGGTERVASEQTINVVNNTYAQTGNSTKTNELGMREMQERAFAKRSSRKLLIKAPPASGKSRALMFIALDKLHNQGVKKAIISVPERAIGASFGNTELSKFGFYWDWKVQDRNNLCTEDGLDDRSKVGAFKRFIDGDDDVLVCTHATLRFACAEIPAEKFNGCLLAIDEFHHVSVSDGSRLGNVLHEIMQNTDAHIVAMTGSYFRGDSVPILTPEDEADFDKVTYTYYEQLNGYKYLKTLGIGYHFYTGNYLSDRALADVLDTHKKTIVHIPNIQSSESGNIEKREQVDAIYDIIGDFQYEDENNVDHVKTRDGRMLKVANLVEDDSSHRKKLVDYLSTTARDNVDGIDIIVALNMAKEGFDWPFCEHALTIGYRSSLTEVVQIIGRCTRDSSNKDHAQFTNLIVRPAGTKDDVTIAVNNMLKAITVSLLMEQVLAPVFKFTPPPSEPRKPKPGEVFIKGLKVPQTERGKQIIETDLEDLVAKVLQDTRMERANANNVSGIYTKQVESDIIKKSYPDLENSEIEAIRQHVAAKIALASAKIVSENNGDDNDKFIKLANRFVKIDELDINLIDSVNPFHHAFEVLSKKMDSVDFKLIQDIISKEDVSFTDEDAVALFPKLDEFVKRNNGRGPSLQSTDKDERLLAKLVLFFTRKKMELNRMQRENNVNE